MQIEIALVLVFVLSASALTESEYQTAFQNFQAKYEKNYIDSEVQYRYTIFKSNLDFVNNWDAKSRGFQVKMNSFGDLTVQEFSRIYNGLNITKKTDKRAYVQGTKPALPKDAVVDWRTKGAVTGIKDQGQCGSCWSFSATGSMEGAYFLSTGNLVSLSEQNLIDCSTSQGNEGCNGGLMDQAFQYVIQNSGIDTEASYPYTASGPNSCQYDVSNLGAKISAYADVSSGDEGALQSAANNQPISVAIDASHSSFQFYSSGVYSEPACSSTQLDHGVLVVGYGTESGSAYWIVKNSWGTSWGDNGYILMSRNNGNNCGIATSASYPTV
jgi:cathepsin L